MSDCTYDAIVLGVGGMGSAVVCELARRGLRVLGLEQFGIGHDLGSSHGRTRIIRTAYYEHPEYVPLVRRAFERWRDLERQSGRHLLTECGCLSFGPPDSELILGVGASALQHNLPVENLTSGEIGTRFSAFRFREPYVGVLERSAGFLAVEQCVLAHVAEAKKLGAVLHEREAVLSWETKGAGVAVQTTKGRYATAKLVITAGPWAARLLGRLGVNLSVMRQVALWFGTSNDAMFRRDVFPIYVAQTEFGYFYGFPMSDGDDGIKVAQHYGAVELGGPNDVDRAVQPADEDNVRRFLRAHLPAADGSLRHGSVCIYTLTPDRHFLIGLHPEHANVSIAAGFSGHGFKFASVVGEIVADLAEKGRTDLPIAMFRPDRFARK